MPLAKGKSWPREVKPTAALSDKTARPRARAVATRSSSPLSIQLRALAARRDAAGARVLLQAAKALDRLLATGKCTSPRAAPALARLLTAALVHPAGWSRRPFTFTHDGHRYRVRTFVTGSTSVSTMGDLDLTLALQPLPKGPSK